MDWYRHAQAEPQETQEYTPEEMASMRPSARPQPDTPPRLRRMKRKKKPRNLWRKNR